MLHFYDRAGFARLNELDLEPRLRRLLADRIANLTEDLKDYTEYIALLPGESEDDLIRHIGFSPLVDPIDGGRRPHHDYATYHDGWVELIFTFGSTHCCIVLIPDTDGVPDDLRALCRDTPKT